MFGGEGGCEDNSVYSGTSLKEFKVDFWSERKCIQKLGISAVLLEYASKSMVNCPSEAQSCCGLSKWHRGKSIAFPSHPVLADLAGKMQPWDILISSRKIWTLLILAVLLTLDDTNPEQLGFLFWDSV